MPVIKFPLKKKIYIYIYIYEENDKKTEDDYNDRDGDAEDDEVTEEQQSEKNEIDKVENGITSVTFSVILANLRPATLFSIMFDIENHRIKPLLD